MLKIICGVMISIGVFCIGMCFLVKTCSKNGYSFKYKSTKRKFEIYPNANDKSQTTQKKLKNDDE